MRLLMMFDLRRLEVLHHVARRGSFSSAAFDLRYSPSAVSQQMGLLEQEVGVRLLERHSRGVRLTEAGHVLLRHSELAFGHLEAARAELSALARGTHGRVMLGAFGSAWGELIPRSVAQFRELRPDVELSLVEADPRDAIASIRSGRLEMAVIFEPNSSDAGHAGSVAIETLADDPLLAVLPTRHRLAGRASVALRDLAADAWVLPTEACGDHVRAVCRAAGFEPRMVFASGDYAAVQGFVAACSAVALVPRLAVASGRRGIVARSLNDCAPVRRISVATAANGHRSAAVAEMIGVLKRTASDDAPYRHLAVAVAG